MRTLVFIMVYCLALWAGAGCSPPSKTQTVSGKVLVDGRPAGGARVIFTPAGGASHRPMAITREDGAFRMAGPDGAPAGDYAVTVVWPTFAVNGGEEVETGDRLANRYGNPASPAARVTVRDGGNELPPFELRTPPR